MPIYDYKCVNCSNSQEGWNKVDDRHNSPSCESCGNKTKLTIMAPVNVNPDIEPFQCMGFDHNMQETEKTRTPTHFRSRKHMNDELKARNLSIKNPKNAPRWI